MPQQTPYTPNVDPLEALLKRSPVTDAHRSQLWDLFESSPTTDDLTTKLEALAVPREVKAKLWELKAQETAPVPKEIGMLDAQGKPLNDGSFFAAPSVDAAVRFATPIVKMPVDIAKGAYGLVTSPIDTTRGIVQAQKGQYDKAKQAEAEGRWSEMAAYSVAAAVPFVGPAVTDAGETIASGDVAGGLGKATALVAPAVAARAYSARRAPNPVKADRLTREATDTVSGRVLAPGNAKYKAPAQKVAPEILKRGVQGDRVAVAQWADDLISDAQVRIDQVIDSYPDTATLATKPVVSSLDDAMKTMTFGGEVNPALSAAFNELKTLRDFIAGRGDQMSFADMRRLRQQLDGVADRAGKFSKASGDTSVGAAADAAFEASSALRRQIASQRPELAVPNADMHLGITVRDILDPAKGRPKTPSVTTGATGGLHTTGAIIGSVASHIPIVRALAAFVASDLIPRIKNAQVSPQHQLRLAQKQYQLAEALRTGQIGPAKQAILGMTPYVPGVADGLSKVTTATAVPGGQR
jgi:hypothetical protein